MSFINLHVHSAQGSLLDSILTTKQIVNYAKRNNQPAIALSDHGAMYASLNLVNDCYKAGIKPITACEIYECDNHLEQNQEDKYNHLLLIARTTEGLHNLYEIVSEGYVNGFYRKPRVSVQWIKENNLGRGIICLTACQAGRLSRCLEAEMYEEAEVFVRLLKETFDYVSLEIQSHPTKEQLKCNTLIFNFAAYMKMSYCITSDAHMETADQLDTHSIFVSISQDREVGESYVGCHLQNEEDVFRYLGNWNFDTVIQRGIDETVKIANMVDDNIDYELNKGTVMPPAHIPDGYDVESYFRYLVYSTFDEKFGHMSQEEQQKRRDRIESEIPVLKELDFLNYLLIQYEFCNECDKRGIPRGYSRGSAANCLCVFMLNVTQVDSVRFGLDFARFANLGRKGSVADIDLDLSKARRQEAIQVLCDIFGEDHVAPMATFNTLSTKVAIKDIAKVLNEREDSPYFDQLPYSVRDEITKMIPTVKTLNDLGEEEEKDVLLKELVGKNEKLDAYHKQFPLLFKYVMELEGLPKSRGRHASGTLLTPKPVVFYSPLCLDNDKNVMSMFDMHICQDTEGGLGLCKEDLLGLETLDIVDMALKNAGLTWRDVDINHLDLEDKRVYDEVYNSGNTVGIFQFESYEARAMSIAAHVDDIEAVIAVNASNRPGTKDSFPDYCKNKLYPEQIQSIHPDLDDLFKTTHSILLYQEDALHLFAYAGFPEDRQDVARRAIGKKKKDVMDSLYKEFYDGLVVKQWAQKQIEDVWALLAKQAEYSFNRGHAVAYSLLSYLTAWLKVHYTTEFMAALLTSKSDKTEKLSSIINDCNRMGIKVLPPKINESKSTFTAIPERSEILFGFNAIKGIGDSVVTRIIEGQPYSGFNDYLEKIQDKTATIALIKAGAFPCNSKMKLMQRYAKSLFVAKEFKPVSTLPTKAKLLLDWDINTEDFKVGKKVDKEAVLKLYNNKKEEQFQAEQKVKLQVHMNDFKNKYATDEFMWEFQAMSMFVNENPLREAYEIIGTEWSDVADDTKAVVPCVIVDIKRKKDRNNNPFAYIDLCTNNQIVEGTIWSKQLKEYNDLVEKGNCVCILGRKKDNHLFVESVKPYNKWLVDIKKRRRKGKC